MCPINFRQTGHKAAYSLACSAANLKEMAVGFLCCSLTAEWNEARCAPLIRAPVCPCVCVGVDGMFPFAYLK